MRPTPVWIIVAAIAALGACDAGDGLGAGGGSGAGGDGGGSGGTTGSGGSSGSGGAAGGGGGSGGWGSAGGAGGGGSGGTGNTAGMEQAGGSGGDRDPGGTGGTPAMISFHHQVVDANGPSSQWGKTVGDLNGDDLPDIVVGGNDGGGLVWYQNPAWTKRTIASSGAFSTDHEVCDVDDDGDSDVVATTTAELLWYANPGWGATSIANQGLHDIEVLDFDADGDCDVVGRRQAEFGDDGSLLYLYEQNHPSSWSSSTVAIPDGEGLKAADLDGDGDVDIVTNMVWQENDGAGSFTAHRYMTTPWAQGEDSTYIDVADIDGDGNPDIILSPSELVNELNRELAWFEAPDDPKSSADWTKHTVIASTESSHHFVGTGDFDLDGDIDIATAEVDNGADPDPVTILRNDGSGIWVPFTIYAGGSHSMRVFDVELDGDLDLMGSNWDGHQVDLFINQANP